LLRTPKRSHAIDNLEEVSGLACPRCGHPASLRLWMNTGRQVGWSLGSQPPIDGAAQGLTRLRDGACSGEEMCFWRGHVASVIVSARGPFFRPVVRLGSLSDSECVCGSKAGAGEEARRRLNLPLMPLRRCGLPWPVIGTNGRKKRARRERLAPHLVPGRPAPAIKSTA